MAAIKRLALGEFIAAMVLLPLLNGNNNNPRKNQNCPAQDAPEFGVTIYCFLGMSGIVYRFHRIKRYILRDAPEKPALGDNRLPDDLPYLGKSEEEIS